MNSRVPGDRWALRRVMNAKVSISGGSKPMVPSRREKPRTSITERVETVSPILRAASSSAAVTYSTSICGSIATPALWARSRSWRRAGATAAQRAAEGVAGRPAGALGALAQRAARGVDGRPASVVEDQRRLGEAFDGHRLLEAGGVGRD